MEVSIKPAAKVSMTLDRAQTQSLWFLLEAMPESQMIEILEAAKWEPDVAELMMQDIKELREKLHIAIEFLPEPVGDGSSKLLITLEKLEQLCKLPRRTSTFQPEGDACLGLRCVYGVVVSIGYNYTDGKALVRFRP